MLEPRKVHDKAIIGFKEVVLYDYELLIEGFLELGLSYDEALEWIDYNTVRSGQYIKGWPKIKGYYDDSDENEE